MLKIGLIDPDISVLQLVKKILESSGYSCHVFTNGEELISKLKSVMFDLVISEWKLPNISGEDLCKALLKKSDTTPIIFLSGIRDSDIRTKALQSGAIDYLTKPFDREYLTAKVKSVSTLIRNVKKQREQDCFSNNPSDIFTTLNIQKTQEIYKQYPLAKLARENSLNVLSDNLFEPFFQIEKHYHNMRRQPYAFVQIKILAVSEIENNDDTYRKLTNVLIIIKKIIKSEDVVFFRPPDILLLFLPYTLILEAEQKERRLRSYLERLNLLFLVEIHLSIADQVKTSLTTDS